MTRPVSRRNPIEGVTQLLVDGTNLLHEIASQKEVLLGGEPLAGELLLAGTDPDGRQWVAGVSGDWPGRPEGCYLFPAQGRAAGDWIETTTGFRLPKSSAFADARSPRSAEFTSDQGVFCLNERGEVTSYDVR